MTDEEPLSCVLCSRTLRDETMTCLRCLERLDETLEAIVEFYALLPSVILPGSVTLDDMPHGKQVDAPAPMRLEVLALRDPRSKSVPGTADDAETRSSLPYVLGILESWARLVREERRLSATDKATIIGETALLRKHLDWIGAQPWIDDFSREIKQVHRTLRQTAGESVPKPIGACPAERIVNGIPTICGKSLYAPTSGDVVQCRRCRTSWDRPKWLLLGRIIKEGEAS